MKRNILVQIGIIFGICLAGDLIASFLPFAFPGNVIGMLILFGLLLSGLLKEDDLRESGDFLRKNMAFFFIPAGVSLMSRFDLLRDHLAALLIICLVSTVLTFGAAALTIRLVCRLQRSFRKEGR